MDFTIKTYRRLLQALNNDGYGFQPFAEFIEKPLEKAIVLRHDVDAKKLNSLRFARIQAESGIRGSYYFRVVPQSFDERVIREIAAMGHEVGYHYETMDTQHGDVDRAWEEFRRNLEMFRKIVPVRTVCMHGSPLSRHDNRDLWKKYDYRELGILGEPYLDLDFAKVGYLTDTGRRWDGEKVSVRDKVRYGGRGSGDGDWGLDNEYQGTKNEERKSTQHSTLNSQHLSFHSTNDIITAAESNRLPDQLMLTFHPQRWTDKPLPWLKELVWQNVKNQIKKFMVK